MSEHFLNTLPFIDGYTRAVQHYAAGQTQDSRCALEQLLETQPDHYPARLLLAAIALGEADTETAEFCLKSLLQQHFGNADACIQAGKIAEAGGFLELAEIAFRQAGQLIPNNIDARYYLSLALQRNGKAKEALAVLDEVIELAPGFIGAYLERATVLTSLNQYEESEATFRQALLIDATSAELHYHFALLLEQLCRTAEAENSYYQALLLKPDFVDALIHLANLLKNTQRRETAEIYYRQSVLLHPYYADAHLHLGVLLLDDKRYDEAEYALREALRLQPDSTDAINNYGILLMEAGRMTEAVAAYREALRLNSNSAAYHNNLGLALTELGCNEEAEAAFQKALHIQPEFVEAVHNMSILRKNCGRMEEAEALSREALRIKPDYSDALNHAGVLALDNGRLDEAADWFRKAVELHPQAWDGHWCLGFLHLLRAEFEQGWLAFEHRFESVLRKYRRNFVAPRWDGSEFVGQTLLIYCEQGLGDSIQFVRYLPEVAQRGGKVWLECPQELKRLFENMAGIDQLIVYGEDLPEFDVHCPLLSLPLLFETRLDSIPASTPYLTLPAQIRLSAPRLATRNHARLKVGLAWAGNPEHKNDRNRSLCLEWLEPLFQVPGITWVILQKTRRPEGFEAQVVRREWLDPVVNAGDLADTAAIIEQLDLMIGVDTALIHLAGALNIPTWALIPCNPDWRWMLEREDSPWYPGMRLFRQKQRNAWPEVIEKVCMALTDWINTKPN